MKQYLEALETVLTKGKDRSDRTGVGTRGIFGYQMRMDMADGFPLLTTKKIHTKSVLWELLWFLSGSTNIKMLKDNGVTIWDEWADENGELGPVYGKQWRRWDHIHPDGSKYVFNCKYIDQIANLIHDLRHNPFSRRHIVSAWNVGDVPMMKLPPCHTLWQCYVEESGFGEKRLSLHLYARSIDIFLGLPFNIASYAFLLHMLACVTGMLPGDLVISFGDLHLYKNHINQAKEQLSRSPRALPRLALIERGMIESFRFEDFEIIGYDPHPTIKAPIAV